MEILYKDGIWLGPPSIAVHRHLYTEVEWGDYPHLISGMKRELQMVWGMHPHYRPTGWTREHWQVDEDGQLEIMLYQPAEKKAE